MVGELKIYIFWCQLFFCICLFCGAENLQYNFAEQEKSIINFPTGAKQNLPSLSTPVLPLIKKFLWKLENN